MIPKARVIRELRYEDRDIRELEDALVHVWEFIDPNHCPGCQRIKDMTYEFIQERARELERGETIVLK